MKQDIDKKMEERGWKPYPLKNGGWGEVTYRQFYRENGDGTAQSVEIGDWLMDADEVVQKAENAGKRKISDQYWLTYAPAIIK